MLLAIPARAQLNTLPETVNDEPTAADLNFLYQQSQKNVSNTNQLLQVISIATQVVQGTTNQVIVSTDSNFPGKYVLNTPQDIAKVSTVTFGTLYVGQGANQSTITYTGNFQLVKNASITYVNALYIASSPAQTPILYIDPNGSVGIHSTQTISGVPMVVQGQFRDIYDPSTNGGGQEVMQSKSGKLWDWTAGYGTGSNQNAFVMNETGILTTIVCLPSGGNNPLCGINNNSVTVSNPAYAWDVNGDINASGVFRDGTTSGVTNTCTSNQLLNSQNNKGGIVTGGSCDAVRDNQVVLTTNAIVSGTFGDNRVAISTGGVTSGKFGDDKVSISTAGVGSGRFPDGQVGITTGAIISGQFGDNRVGISTNGVISGAFPDARVGITTAAVISGAFPDARVGITTAAIISGTMTVAFGGTGITSATSMGIFYGQGTSAFGVTAAGTSSQCLNGGSPPTWGSCTSGSVTGTGTTNTISKFTGASSIGNSSISDNGTNVNTLESVSIGTTTATYALNVSAVNPRVYIPASGTGFSLSYLTTNGDQSGLWTGVDNSVGSISGTSYAGLVQTTNTNPLILGANQGSNITILNGGNVGISTTGPISKFEVTNANPGTVGILLDPSNGGRMDSSIGWIDSNNAAARNWFAGVGVVAYGDFSIDQANAFGGTVNTGTSRFYINPSGNVGIGTTNPSANLEVSSDTVIDGTMTVVGIIHDGLTVAVNNCGAGTVQCDVNCPAGTYAISGGCSEQAGATSAIITTCMEASPGSGSCATSMPVIGWYCRNEGSATLSAYVYCARMKP